MARSHEIGNGFYVYQLGRDSSCQPPGIVPVGNKWIFKRKIGLDGKVETYKARLVAKGYKQREEIDYEETFFPATMTKSIRILLAIAAYHDYEIWKMDMKTAFLNGHL